MKIREATMQDIDAIVAMAERFYPESPYPAIYGDMPQSQAAGLAIIAIRGMADFGVAPGVMLVAEGDDGRLAGMLCLHIDAATFNPEVVSGEIVWWMEPEHRGGLAALRLLKAGEAAALARGATVNRMAVLSTSPEQAGALYERMGYAHTETYYTKRLH